MCHSNTRFTYSEVAHLSDKSPREISRDIQSGLLPVTRKGRTVSVALDDLKHYLNIDEQAEAAATQRLPLLDLLPGLAPGSESRVFLTKVALILHNGVINGMVPDSSTKAVRVAIGILSGTAPHLGDRVDVVGFHEDWGSFRVLAGTRAFDLLVTGRNQELNYAWPGPAVCFKGFQLDEINPRAFEAMAQLIEGVVEAQDTHLFQARSWVSPASRANRLQRFLDYRRS